MTRLTLRCFDAAFSRNGNLALSHLTEASMNRFVHERNIKHLRETLARTANEAECRRIVGQIEEEEEQGRKSPGGLNYEKICD
jgi:hypothetical protein